MTIELRTPTAGDTRTVGEAVAPLLRAGDVAILTGELGAGKTTLVQGVARGLGSQDPVASPTFTLIREYGGGRLRIAHVDVYRLDRMQDVVELGLDELLDDGDTVLLVEWGDAVEDVLPPGRLRVELSGLEPDLEDRRIVLSDPDGAWTERWEQLELATDPWRGP
jgi:tRNA threonylcarbamoyladenosine biosynthesis protein TsaE